MLDPLFVQLQLPPMVIAILAAVTCAIPGNFLLLRGQALIGDAISHVVLPGIVLAFLVSGGVSPWAMLVGAAIAAMLSVASIEAIRRIAGIEAGAAMAVVFTTVFAGGVLLLELTDTSAVHLDVEHALHGNLESLIWFDAVGWESLLDPTALAGLPTALPALAVAVVLMVLFVGLTWRALVISTFDAYFARGIGIRGGWLGLGLVLVTAVAAVVAFDAVGSIIVIAMFICPPATARLLTDRLSHQVWISSGLGLVAAVLGFWLAGVLPSWFGARFAVSAAGMIAVVAGLQLALACAFGPYRHRLASRPVG